METHSSPFFDGFVLKKNVNHWFEQNKRGKRGTARASPINTNILFMFRHLKCRNREKRRQNELSREKIWSSGRCARAFRWLFFLFSFYSTIHSIIRFSNAVRKITLAENADCIFSIKSIIRRLTSFNSPLFHSFFFCFWLNAKPAADMAKWNETKFH